MSTSFHGTGSSSNEAPAVGSEAREHVALKPRRAEREPWHERGPRQRRDRAEVRERQGPLALNAVEQRRERLQKIRPRRGAPRRAPR
eukprot:CAMPEP_0180163178 /NCGR_PEP_ID=MMETSP0986-20121125/29655_1 /TAXON_ID=697907 /ORGANISM="non described non described, Strain CCMP2293" /LENGTH=86 /DNA_ID=CAMNT_0022113785 /DNA_START=19 /DNA_END=277 /DNA_ORIENTATION=+